MSQRLKDFFRATPELHRLSGQAGQLLVLQRHYEKVAPASLLSCSRVSQLESGTLTLVADNGAVAAKLRQLAPELARLLQNRGCEVTGIRVKVQVAAPAAARVRRSGTLSPEGKKQLASLADKLPDSPLKNALRHFAGQDKS